MALGGRRRPPLASLAPHQPRPARDAAYALAARLTKLVRRLANGSRRTHRRWALAERFHLGFPDVALVVSRSPKRGRRWPRDVLGLFRSSELVDVRVDRLRSLPAMAPHTAVIQVLGADPALGGTSLLDTRQTVALEVLDGAARTLPIKIAATGEHRYENGEK